jgi:drug/metabolite transporter (DMT)-like permease
MNNLFVLYFLFLPFQFALSPVPGVDLASIRLLTLFLFLVWLSRGLIQRRILLPKLFPLFLFSGFLFIAFGSFLWSEHIVLALRKTLFLFSFAPLFIILASWFEEQRSARLVVLTSFVVGAFLSAITGIFFF